MCIGPFAPRAFQAQTPPPPPAPIKPVSVPQNVVLDRDSLRRRALLSSGPGQNRTLLSGSLAAAPSSGSTILG